MKELIKNKQFLNALEQFRQVLTKRGYELVLTGEGFKINKIKTDD